MISFDTRVGSREFPSIPPLTDYPTVLVNFKKYEIPGDAYFDGIGHDGPIDFGVEIKSLADLVSSLDSARLQGQGVGESHGQLLRMLDTFDVTMLIYYGDYRATDDDKPLITYRTGRRYVALDYGGRPYYWQGINAALAELQYLGVQVYRVNDKREVALLIATIYSLFQKSWHKHKLLRAFNTSANVSRAISIVKTIPHHIKIAAKILTGIEQISYERALAISNHYDGDIAMIFISLARDPKAIATITTASGRAIGPVVSDAVHRIVRPRTTLDAKAIAARLGVK